MQANDIFKCALCANIIRVVDPKAGALNCCGKPMNAVTENSVDASKEKHVPVIEYTANGMIVKVGSVAHPMEEKHFIQWIEVIADGKTCIRTLKPGDKPETTFACTDKNVKVREYCNLHGLWKA
ncbi:MAG: desulfoferrodoxin [Candidatus Riflebacteria bacterium]|nr:desulfoferrodoxin [Candidatus Riflebacteria bacterium]